MATATATGTQTPRIPVPAVLSGYLVLLVLAESLIAYGDGVRSASIEEAGLAVHILLVFALLIHGVVVQPRQATLGALLTALSLASLIRVYSLALPPLPGQILPRDTLVRLALVSAPLLVSIAAVAYVQRIRPRDLGILTPLRDWPVQAAIALTGLPLGVVEYYILRPEPWISELTLPAVVGATLVIFLATGVSEELIFRGILMRRAIEGLGTTAGLMFVSVAFTALHIFFRSPADLAFVFGVALFYGGAVIRTRSLWGAIGSHTLGNVVLYLLAPFLIG